LYCIISLIRLIEILSFFPPFLSLSSHHLQVVYASLLARSFVQYLKNSTWYQSPQATSKDHHQHSFAGTEDGTKQQERWITHRQFFLRLTFSPRSTCHRSVSHISKSMIWVNLVFGTETHCIRMLTLAKNLQYPHRSLEDKVVLSDI
jgi:hypothetical protein